MIPSDDDVVDVIDDGDGYYDAMKLWNYDLVTSTILFDDDTLCWW